MNILRERKTKTHTKIFWYWIHLTKMIFTRSSQCTKITFSLWCSTFLSILLLEKGKSSLKLAHIVFFFLNKFYSCVLWSMKSLGSVLFLFFPLCSPHPGNYIFFALLCYQKFGMPSLEPKSTVDQFQVPLLFVEFNIILLQWALVSFLTKILTASVSKAGAYLWHICHSLFILPERQDWPFHSGDWWLWDC